MDEVEVRTKKQKQKYKSILERSSLGGVLNASEEKELINLGSSRVLLIRKEKGEKTVNIDEIIF